MNWSARLWGVFAAAILLSGCNAKETGDYFQFDGKLFIFNYRIASANYLVNIKRLRTLEPGYVAVVHFEDPAGGQPIIVREKIWPDTRRTTINSPPVRCIVKDRPYSVVVRIEDARGDALQTLETTMVSNQDQDVLPEKPLVIGPLYTPNVRGVGAASTGKGVCPSK
jgi:hypothetical protein